MNKKKGECFMYYCGEFVFRKLSNGKYIMIANRYGEIEKGFFTDEDLNYLKKVYKIEIRSTTHHLAP